MMLQDLTKSSNFIGEAILNKGFDYQNRMYVYHSTMQHDRNKLYYTYR